MLLYLISIVKLICTILVVSMTLLIYLIKLLNNSKDDKHVFIVVLGDIGRSPRMNYHCLSLVKLGYKVSIIGYKGIFKPSLH